MFKSYFYLLRCVKDLSKFVNGKRIVEIYTQEKDKIFLRLSSAENQHFHIIISTNPQLPYINIKEDHRKAKKNYKNFFDDFLPDKILKIEIALGDRIIKFTLDKSELYFVIKGAATNFFLVGNNSELKYFKKIEYENADKVLIELKSINYITYPDSVIEILNCKSKEEILNSYKFVDKDLIKEIDSRTGIWHNNLIKVIEEIFSEDISVVMNDIMPRPRFIPFSFRDSESQNNYGDYFAALNKYLTLFYSIGKDKILKAELYKYLEKEIEKSANKLNNIKSRIESGCKDEHYSTMAKLLLANIYNIKKGIKEIEAEDDKLGIVKIKLDEKLSPQKNVDALFDKARAEKINYQKSKELFSSMEKDYLKLLEIQKRISENISYDQLSAIKKELKIKMDIQKQENNKERNFNFRHFVIEGKYHLYVGKDSKNNDLLTTRFAKQNDFWFHARAVSGSHAVLRIDNTKEAVPKNILKKAASIAAFYSKSKTSKLAPVSYTFKKFVVKKKDLDPGQVILLKENVLLVPPEIPEGCEMIEED